MLRSNLCDYSDIYIFVKGRTLVDGTAEPNEKNEILPLELMLHLGHAYQK